MQRIGFSTRCFSVCLLLVGSLCKKPEQFFVQSVEVNKRSDGMGYWDYQKCGRTWALRVCRACEGALWCL